MLHLQGVVEMINRLNILRDEIEWWPKRVLLFTYNQKRKSKNGRTWELKVTD